MNVKPLDLINTPLDGINLIEASAGTGKTYTIEGLFVRLILEKCFRVDKILVVTFTKAATEELRDRIRKKLVQAKEAFDTGASQDNLLADLLNKHTDPAAASRLVHDALVEFDKAAIFTIHGFCARILYEHAFETQNLFDTELMTDQTELIQEISEDFWRHNFYNAPLEFISYFTEKIKGPRYFRQLLSKIRAAEIKIVPQIVEPSLKNLHPFRKAFVRLKEQWPASRQSVIEALRNPSLNAAQYGSLRPDETLAGLTKRDIKIVSMIDAMDRYTDPNSTGFPLFKNFEKFTAQKMSRAVKKNQSAPTHKYFRTCDDVYQHATALEAEMENYFIYLKAQLFAFASSELIDRKSERNLQFFDDLLMLVKQALAAPRGNPLAEAIRQKYKAALVDEFQDTDSVQYEIFSKLFSAKGCLLFMIGDPKQAIYSFRGADIFSYLKAAQHARAKFTLTENWRSQPRLITAVNTIFSNLKAPFIFEEISFEDGKPGNQGFAESGNGNPPLTLWYLDSRTYSNQNKPINKTASVQLIAGAVADEICRIVSAEAKPVSPGDIAVLVRTNRQAQIINAHLSARGLPAVLYSTGNIFDSREAMEIEKVLASISEPDNMEYLKAALAMDMMGVKGEDLLPSALESPQWESRLTRMRQYFLMWHQSGFMRMFRWFLARENVRQRLLSFADGERRLTNLLHLAEILHQESTEKNLGVGSLLNWLAEQRHPESTRLEEHQLRLESDAAAVKIVTIHKSKGLEYEVVFCPYTWEGSLVKDSELIFHEADDNKSLTLDLGSASRAQNLIHAQNEQLAENIRLLYVALTRAKSRCYLAWGRINTADTSALAYLLHHGGGLAPGNRSADIVGELKKQVAAKSDKELLADLNQLAKKSKGSIQVLSLPEASGRFFIAGPQTRESLTCRAFSGTIDRSWKVSSYTSLVSRRMADIDLPDRDAFADLLWHMPAYSPEWIEAGEPDDRTDISMFPKGSRAGNFFHDIFEELDYTTQSSATINELVLKNLQAYGFEKSWQPTIVATIRQALTVGLRPDQPDLTLSRIECDNRINEMEFYFPLNPITPQKLQSLFNQPGNTEVDGKFPAAIEKLVFAPAAGFMKGYVDLIFQHRGRFYLVDWKSNYLGPTPEDYNQRVLAQAMQENYYVLQYHFYTLALCQYLRVRKSDFQYGSDFGGVFYIFIRGIDSRRGPELGIYFDHPEATHINTLGKALIPGFEALM